MSINSNYYQFWSQPEDSENVRNAPLTEPEVNPLQTNFQFPDFKAPTTPQLDRQSLLDESLKYNQLGAQDALNTSKSAGDQTALTATNAKIANQRLDNSAALNNSQIQTPTQQRQANSFGGGGSYQGNAGYLDFVDQISNRGLPGYQNQYQAQSNFNNQRNQALQSTALFGRAGAEGNIYQAQQLANVANQSANNDQNRQIDLINRQNSINSQNSANDYLRLAQQNAQDRTSRERVAATQAQANIYSSLLGSVGVGGSNYRYWS